MRRPRLVLVLLAAVVVAGAVGAWLGARSLPDPPAPPADVVPIAPGAPERAESLLPVADDAGIGGQDAALTPDGRTLVTVDADGRLAVVDLATRRVGRVVTGLPGPDLAVPTGGARDRHALAVAPDGRTVWVTDGRGRRVHVVDLPTRTVFAAVAIPSVPTAVAVAGDTVAVGDATGAVTTVDAPSRRPLALRDVAAGPVADLAASPDGRHVVVAADPGGVVGPGSVSAVDLTDPRAPTVPYSWPVSRPHGLGGTSVVVAPDGARAYVVTGPRVGAAAPDADTAGGVVVLDLRAGREVTTVPGTHATALALSPDGRRLHLARRPSVPSGPGSTDLVVVETVDITAITTTVTTPTSDIGSGPPGRPIGSVVLEPSTGSAAWLLAAPDGRRLYAPVDGLSAISLRSG